MSHADSEVKTGWKWKVAEAVSSAESRLRHRVLVGKVASGKAGLAVVQHLAMTRHRGRGACSSGKSANQQDVWNAESGSLDKMGAGSELQTEQWKAEPHRVRFLIQTVYDELPSPSNLFR